MLNRLISLRGMSGNFIILTQNEDAMTNDSYICKDIMHFSISISFSHVEFYNDFYIIQIIRDFSSYE